MRTGVTILAAIAGSLTLLVALFAAISGIIYYPWANDCERSGNTVQEYGYGIPMLTSTYVCVDSAGNIVAVL